MRRKFKANQRADAAAEHEGRFVTERGNQSCCVVAMCRDVISFRLNRCAARETAAVVGNDREIAGKLIRQVLRAVSITGATLENQQHGPGTADDVIEGHFVCPELAVSHIRLPDIRLPDIMDSCQEKSSNLP
jgi:hypothetical protein